MQTGYYIDSSGYIQGPQNGGQYYVNGTFIYGPNCQGSFWIDSGGNICGNSGHTGFVVRDKAILGPSTQLPWF